MTIYAFITSGEAYDACQCDDQIKNGDTLFVPSENIVALAWTWPCAVTLEHGALHKPSADANMPRLLEEAHWTREQVAAALKLARELNYPVNPQWEEVAQ